MRGMRPPAQAIDHEDVRACEAAHHRRRYLAKISRVNDRFAVGIEAETRARHRSVRHFDMVEGKPRNQLNIFDIFERYHRRIAELAFEDIVEAPPQPLAGHAAGETRQGIAAVVAHDPQIVDSMTMVGMVMRPEYRIDLLDIVAEQLRTQIGRSVDEDLLAGVVFNDHRHARAPVARLGGIALAPVIANPRHPGGRAGPEHQYLHAAALPKSA